jgi:hypothetical protein
MGESIKQLLHTRAFEPFTVVTNGGTRYFVASPDHASLGPKNLQMSIWFDDGSGVMVSIRNVAAVEKQSFEPGSVA